MQLLFLTVIELTNLSRIGNDPVRLDKKHLLIMFKQNFELNKFIKWKNM